MKKDRKAGSRRDTPRGLHKFRFNFNGGECDAMGRARDRKSKREAEKQALVKKAVELARPIREGTDQGLAPPVDLRLLTKYAYGQLDEAAAAEIDLLKIKYKAWSEAFIQIMLRKVAEKN